MTKTVDALGRFSEQAGRLYSLPAVAVRVMELTNHPKVDARALKECIENDPALTTKILRVVNSSLFGLSRKVSDLNQALALLGTKPLKLLVLGFNLPDDLFVELSGSALQHYWRATLTKAVAARQFSEMLGGKNGDEAFIAGLLQDLGELVLIQQLGEPYSVFLQKVRSESADQLALESRCFGFDHCRLTAEMLKGWDLPDTIVQAVANSVSPDYEPPDSTSEPDQNITWALHMAGRVTNLLVDRRVDELKSLLAHGKRDNRFDENRLSEMAAAIGERVEQLADVLSVELNGKTDYRDVLIQSQEKLAAVAADVVPEVVRAERARLGSEHPEEDVLDEARKLGHVVKRFLQSSTGGALPSGQNSTTRVDGAAVRGGKDSNNSSAGSSNETPTSQPDPCSTLETHSAIEMRLSRAAATCRQGRQPLAVLLVELHDYADMVFSRGNPNAEKVGRLVEVLCRSVDHPQAECVVVGEVQFLVILPDCERKEGVALANGLLRRANDINAAEVNASQENWYIGIGVSAVSLLSKNFQAVGLLESAERCLYAVQSSGGNSVKSIEIY